MTRQRSLSVVFLVAGWLGAPSCITDNPAAYSGILGPERERSDGTPAGAAGAGDAGSPGAGGAPKSDGGAPAADGGIGADSGAGAEPSAGEGGAAAITGNGGDTGASAGSSGTPSGNDGGSGATGATGGTTLNPPTHPDFSPACFLSLTEAGEEILKGTPCTAADPQLCYRPCGPNQVGWKTETCLAGVYAEGDCTFPADQTYECYKIPDPIDPGACGISAPPAATDECSAPACLSCNYDGFYQDTGSDVKEGYCVCREPGPDGVRRWTCASATAWPCPLNQGC